MSNYQANQDMSEKYWSFAEEIYRALHQWPLILACMVLGSLFGWGLSYLVPAEYKAIQQVYVGLNPYRSFSDANFLALARPKYSNIDDYKNWQMSQLETAIFLEPIIDETLSGLKALDPYWQDYTKDQVLEMLDADWRSAGVWSLAAYHRQPLRAEQAARVWRKSALSHVDRAILAARDTFLVDQELQANADAILAAEMRMELLTEARSALTTWMEQAQMLPQDQPLTQAERWRLNALAIHPAAYSAGWNALLDSQPTENEPRSTSIQWVAQIIALIDEEGPQLTQQIASLQAERPELTQKYTETLNTSLSLSPALTLEGVDELPAEAVRFPGLLILIGGTCGLLGWSIQQLVRINRKKPCQ